MTTDVDAAALADRVRILEQLMARVSAAPPAPAPMASPPIVIGPFDNVPAPGSPIRSDWPQEISAFVNLIDQRISTSLRSGETSVTTDASGLAAVSLPFTFALTPHIIATSMSTAVPIIISVHSVTTTYWIALCNFANGTPAASAAVRISWIANTGGL